MNRTNAFLLCLVFAAFLLSSASASAQRNQPLETVANRDRPALDALGIRFASYTLASSLSVRSTYNDNIFADESITAEDFIYSIAPAMTLESDWNNHFLSLEAEADIGRYEDNDAEDYDDYSFRADGRLDITRRSYVAGHVLHSQNHEDRTSAEDVAEASLTEYSVDSAAVTYFRQPNRFFLRLNLTMRETDYDDAQTRFAVLNNDDRDRRQTEQAVRLGYEFLPGSSMYLQGTINSWKYDQRIDDAGFQRSSDGYEVVFGASRAISGISSVGAFVGFRSQDLDDPRFETVDGISFGADITWNVTNLITLNVEARRTIEPTTILGASSINATNYGLTIDYELLRRLILSANIEIANDNYEGLDRKDEVFSSGFGMKFMLNRNLYIYLGYEYERRQVRPQDFGDDDYRLNTGFVRLQGQL